ncbi:MAG: oligosaccharide flippase family protein [Patescibacteria group bacterium]
MVEKIKVMLFKLLRKSEKYTKTDMVYLAKGGFWLGMSKMVSAGSAFLLALAFANLLPQEEYGTYKFIFSIVSILIISSMPGINTALTQAVARGFEGSILTSVKTKIKWSTLGALGSLAIAAYYYINNDPTLTYAFLIAAIFLPFIDSFNVYEPYLQGRKMFKQSAILSSILQSTTVLSMIAFLFFTNNVILVVAAHFVMYTLIKYIFYLFVTKKYKPNNKIDPGSVSYGRHLSFINVIGTIGGQIDKILLWHFLGAASLAVYAFALAPVDQFRSMLKSLNILAFPKLAAQDTAVLKKTIPQKMLKLFLLLIIPVTAYILLAPYLYKIFFPLYAESVEYTRWYALFLLKFPTNLMGQTLTAKKQQRTQYKLKIINLITKITLFLVLTPIFGIHGAIATLLIAPVINSILVAYHFYKL